VRTDVCRSVKKKGVKKGKKGHSSRWEVGVEERKIRTDISGREKKKSATRYSGTQTGCPTQENRIKKKLPGRYIPRRARIKKKKGPYTCQAEGKRGLRPAAIRKKEDRLHKEGTWAAHLDDRTQKERREG